MAKTLNENDIWEDGLLIPDGNDALRGDLDAIIELIERTSLWVNPETFRRLPIWAPHAARGKQLYDATWIRPYTNTRKATGQTFEKFEGNVNALDALVAALGVRRPRPKNWTVCHIWGYDDPSFARGSLIVQDRRYFSCIANMVWLPTPLKGFTDTLPEIKSMLRVCAFHTYGWACEHPSVADEAERIRSGWVPSGYPSSWPCCSRPEVLPKGTAPFSKRVENEIEKRKNRIKTSLENTALTYYPRDEVVEVLKFWGIQL